ncbi:hypothetical protein DFH29DRAFT_1004063 [Suillus ampliporus]|nr:hypothetical protein DFH29DRAFT_1004063 [Suillus ampliporus]
MISITLHLASRIAITGFLSVSFFRETVVRPTVQVLSEPKKVSAGLVVSTFGMSTIILLLAANEAAQRFLSDTTNVPFTGGDKATDSPTAQSRRPPADLPVADKREPSEEPMVDDPCPTESPALAPAPAPASPSLQIFFSPFQPSSSSVFESTPFINIDLPPFTFNCNRLSIISNTTTIVAPDDDIFSDEGLHAKDIESSGDEWSVHEDDYATSHPMEHELAHTTHDKHDHDRDFDILLPTLTTTPIDDGPSRPPNFPPSILVDPFRTTSLSTDPSLPGTAHLTDQLLQKTKATHSLRGSRSATSWLRPMILVTKRVAGRLVPLPPVAVPRYQKSRPDKLKSDIQQKRKLRGSRLNAACHSIARSCLARYTNSIGHLTQVCERIREDNAAVIDGWVAGMAEVGLSSVLTGRSTLPALSLLPPRVDSSTPSEPGS